MEYSALCLSASCYFTMHHWVESCFTFFIPSYQVSMHMDKTPPEPSLGSTVPALFISPHMTPSLWPCAGLSPVSLCLSCTREPKTRCSTPASSRDEHLCQLDRDGQHNAAQCAAGLPSLKSLLLGYDQFNDLQGAQVLCQTIFQVDRSQHILCLGLFLLRNIGISLCWDAWDSCWPISPACRGLSEWQPDIAATPSFVPSASWWGCFQAINENAK